MRLVELLAKELSEWAYHDQVAAQDADGNIYLWSGNPEWVRGVWLETESAEVCGSIFEGRDTLATDHATAIVTREMWDAERGKVAGPKQWRGPEDGLPPVGICVLNRHGENRRVVAHDGDTVVCAAGAGGYRGYTPMEQTELRPIPTDREKWIEAADKAIGHGLSLHGKLGALYDAGLAKLPD